MAAARRPLHFQQGFTLLEVLMVVLVVGILSSVVMLSVGTGGAERHLREEANRLAALLEQAASEAVMQNQELGLQLTGSGYRFLCLDEGRQEWASCAEDIFRERELASGLALRLQTPGDIKALPRLKTEKEGTGADQEDADRLSPDLFLLSSGEASTAVLELRVEEAPEQRYEVRVDAIGRVKVAAGGEDEEGAQDAG